MQITVQRAPADRQGPDVVDALLTSDLVGRARGAREVDYSSTDRIIEACQCPAHDYMRTGSMVQVTEAARRWRGVVRYWSLTISLDGDNYTADTRLSVEREA